MRSPSVRPLLISLLCGLLPLSLSVYNVEAREVASSDRATITVYKYRNESGVPSFSDRAPRGTRFEVLHYNCYACDLTSTVDWHNTPLFLRQFTDPINQAARQHGVDPALVRAVIHAESAFRPNALSPKGAQGLMQLMPTTAQDLAVEDPLIPEQNIDGGVRYLAWLLAQHQGNTRLATAAYNAGPGAVRRHQGVPPFAETKTYIERVAILHERYREALHNTASDALAATLNADH